MSRILLCWEIGGNFGHLMRLVPIARELSGRGHEVVWAFAGRRSSAEAVVRAEGFAFVKAPAWDVACEFLPLSQTYGQNLLKNGYRHRDRLRDHLFAWRSLFHSLRPDRLIAEHAPTALLAARDVGLPRVALGTGFSVPPMSHPMPGLPPWFAIPREKLVEHEEAFLDAVNPALRAAGCRVLCRVADIFEGAILCLCTLPEFDHYEGRAPREFLGPVLHSAEDGSSRWPRGQSVFVYLRAANRLLPLLLDALKRLGLSALAFVPDFNGEGGVLAPGIRLTKRPVDLRSIKDRCRFAVTEGGHNTGVRMLLEGIPVLLCPTQLEQAVWSFRLHARGYCEMVSLFNSAVDLDSKIRNLEAGASEEALRELARRHAGWEPERTLDAVVDRCLEGGR